MLAKTKNRSNMPLLNLGLGVILIFLCWPSAKMGLANLSFYTAHQLTERWRLAGKIQDTQSFEKALLAIQKANQLHPHNPYYLITQALVYEWGAVENVPNSDKDYLDQARAYYLEAIKKRPSWPVTWATLAILKWRLGEFDQQMIDYLLQADKFGPNKPEVHKAWLEIGLYLYQQKSPLTPQVIAGLRRHLKLMLQEHRSRAKAIKTIERHKAQKISCRWIRSYPLKQHTTVEQLCKQ